MCFLVASFASYTSLYGSTHPHFLAEIYTKSVSNKANERGQLTTFFHLLLWPKPSTESSGA